MSLLNSRKQLQSIHGLHVITGYLEALKVSQLIRVLAIVALLQQCAATSVIMPSSSYLANEPNIIITCFHSCSTCSPGIGANLNGGAAVSL